MGYGWLYVPVNAMQVHVFTWLWVPVVWVLLSRLGHGQLGHTCKTVCKTLLTVVFVFISPHVKRWVKLHPCSGISSSRRHITI